MVQQGYILVKSYLGKWVSTTVADRSHRSFFSILRFHFPFFAAVFQFVLLFSVN